MALTAAPLVPGEVQFFSAAGVPLGPISGNPALLYTFVPGTSTPKATWQDATQTNVNANPVALDSSGRCVLFGAGQYRLQLFDGAGNLQWDNLGAAADLNTIQSGLTPFTGDTGTGGIQGLVPAPPAGSAAAGDYLSADGSFQPLLVVVPATPAFNQAGFLFTQGRTITGATGTLGLSDAGGSINFNNVSTATTLNIPSDASVAWPINAVTQVLINTIVGAGNLTVTPAVGVSLYWPGVSATPGNRTVAPNGQVVLSRLGTNYWTIAGAGIS